MQSPMAAGATVQSPMAMSSHAPGTPASLGSHTPRLGPGRTMTPQTSMSSSTAGAPAAAAYLSPAFSAFAQHPPMPIPMPPLSLPPQPPPPPGPKMGPPGPVMNSSGGIGNNGGNTHLYPPPHRQGSLALMSTQMQPSTSHALAAQFPPGAALSRLHQYAEGLAAGPDRHTAEYWRAFVNEFYLPSGQMHLVLWNPTSREQKGFDVPASVVSRWLQTNYVSGVRSTQLHLENPREYVSGLSTFPMPPRSTRFVHSVPSANVTHLLETTRATMSMHFDSGWQVQMLGLLRVAFVPATKVASTSPSLTFGGGGGGGAGNGAGGRLETQLRIESFDFLVQSHTSLLPSHSVLRSEIEQPIPIHVVKAILAANGVSTDTPVLPQKQTGEVGKPTTSNATGESSHGNGRESNEKRVDGQKESDGTNKTKESVSDDKKDGIAVKRDREEREGAGAFSVKVDRLSVPDSPVNEYGITLRAMRCLEITESVCQLRDLMDFSMRDRGSSQLGPIDALKRLAMQYKESQKRQAPSSVEVSMNAQQQQQQQQPSQAGLSNKANGDQPPDAAAEAGKASSGATKRSPAPTAASSPNKRAR